MKKILLSLLTIVAVLGTVSLASSAYFTDNEENTGNSIHAGTINIEVDGEDPWELSEPWVVEDIKPSTTHYMEFTVTNTGENTADVWKMLDEVAYDGGLHPESEYDEDAEDTTNDIGSVIRYDMFINDDPLILESDGYTVEDGNHHLEGETEGVANYWMYLGRLAPQESMTVEQSYHMDSDTTNWAQGDNMTFTVNLLAQQVLGNPPAPEEELEGYGRSDYVDDPEEVLDEVNFGDPASESLHNLVGWSGPISPGSGYGGGSDDGNLNLLMGGPGDGCGEGYTSASFTMDAGEFTATSITFNHLDGSQDDSFDVYVEGEKIGHYEWDGNTAEDWVTTTYNFHTPLTGEIEVELISTDPVASWCETYGQVGFSWAMLEY